MEATNETKFGTEVA